MSIIISLQEILLKEIKDLYDAERQLVKTLPEMAKAATSPDLRRAFTIHLEETKNHVARLEQVFDSLGASARGENCKAMKGLMNEGTEAIELDSPDLIRDACLIGAAQKAEHYEIAAYGTLRAVATMTGATDVAELLQQTLNEEKRTDEILSSLADSINEEASLVADEN
jgi:ferritin-like metal-binding protein YciE